ncbi:hypothetical protein ACJX0J_020264, partial [Zea mays]
ATATSGVATSIMPGGRTTHSRFKIPLTIDDGVALPIPTIAVIEGAYYKILHLHKELNQNLTLLLPVFTYLILTTTNHKCKVRIIINLEIWKHKNSCSLAAGVQLQIITSFCQDQKVVVLLGTREKRQFSGAKPSMLFAHLCEAFF